MKLAPKTGMLGKAIKLKNKLQKLEDALVKQMLTAADRAGQAQQDDRGDLAEVAELAELAD